MFIYDDREVDYEKLRAEGQAMEAANQASIKEGGGIMSPQMPQSLSVGMTYDPPSGFLLDVFNMMPGVLYGIALQRHIQKEGAWMTRARPRWSGELQPFS